MLFRSLRKTFGPRCVVDDLSFSIRAGEAFGLLGPNGAGKSTTMMMITGILVPDAGQVLIRDRPMVRSDRSLRSLLGVVPQELAIYPDMTARENLMFFARLYHLSGRILRERVADALEQAGLTPRADDPAGTYSGGMKRRLNFAAAVMHRPELLILDEPTVGVDPQSRAHLLDCVRHLQNSGTSVIYASHYMEEVEAVCSRVAIIDQGRLVACDAISSLLQRTPREVELRLNQPHLPDSLSPGDNVTVQTNGETDGAVLRVRSAAGGSESALHAEVSELLRLLAENSLTVRSIRTLEPNLERLFLQLTGNRLRD